MKNKKFLIIYAIIIFIALIYILFLAPDTMFLKNSDGYKELMKEQTEKIKYDDIETIKQRLLNGTYEYDYSLIHNNIHYICSGEVTSEGESGRCTSPSSFTYTNLDKLTETKLKNLLFTEPANIFYKIEGKTPQESMTNDGKLYMYKTTINNLDTEINLYTNEKTITKISITNGHMTYIIKYKNMLY